MKVNTGKSDCFQLVLELRLRLTTVILNRRDEQVLLGMTIDSNLTFETIY